MTDATLEVAVDPAPGPAGRLTRTAGQAGGAVVLLNLVFAFGWFGAGHWTEAQSSAVTGALFVAVAAVHNAWNWWHAERVRTAGAVTVQAVPAPAKKAPKR